MSGFDLDKFRNLFFDECNMLLDRLENEYLELETDLSNRDLLESVFRAMHTIKGTSGMYGFTFINEFTHHLENIYQSARDGKLHLNKSILDLSLQSVDHIRRLLNDEMLVNLENQQRHHQLLSQIESIGKADKRIEKSVKRQINDSEATWLILFNTDDQMDFRGINLLNIFDELESLGRYTIRKLSTALVPGGQSWLIHLVSKASYNDISDIFMFVDENVRIIRTSTKLETEEVDAEESLLETVKKIESIHSVPIEEDKTKKEKDLGRSKSRRLMVDSDKLDFLMYLVSELVTQNSSLIQDAKRINDPILKEHIEKHSDLSNLFRHSVLDMRLVPLNDSALRFQRLIRDLAGKLEKKIDFKMEGTDIELDKNTIDALNEPLMHIIRNCIDHGIEKPDKRRSLGKSEIGTITLSVVQDGSNVLISVSDNGGGINKEFVRNKAIEKGLVNPSDSLSDKEIYDLIFLPGFSTAQSLTDVSGRGVGMDVVKQKILDLRGEIIINSVPGEGSVFTLKIPQSLNIIDSLLFSVGDNYFIIPLLDVIECNQIILSDFTTRSNTGTIPYNDKLISFIDLRNQLKISGSYKAKVKTIIVNSNKRQYALLVDKIHGEHHAVIRQLTRKARTLPIFNASAQLGDGNTALMIDTEVLLKYCSN